MGQDTDLIGNKSISIMMVGLQGSSKTTTAGKLARKLKEGGAQTLLVAADIYRPAAVEQLKQLGRQLGVPVFHEPGADAVTQCVKGQREAHKKGCKRDHLRYRWPPRHRCPTHGRARGDQGAGRPRQHPVSGRLDDRTGRRRTAAGVQPPPRDLRVLSDQARRRRGGAISIKAVTGKPIKFLGMGETTDKLEVFRPEGSLSASLGWAISRA